MSQVETIHTVEIKHLDQMKQQAQQLAQEAQAGDVVVLVGALGAGKTTFVRALGEALGVRQPITSPTFIIARTHPSLVGGFGLVHVDAYRLQDAVQLEDIDIDFERNLVVLEWGKGLVEHHATNRLEITIERMHGFEGDDQMFDEDQRRTVTYCGYGARWQQWLEAKHT